MIQQIDILRASEVDGYLQRPYARIILPESDGTFRGEIIEFPGCIAAGETATETITSLEDVAKSWLLAALERRQNIPEPIESNNDFSGRLVLRLPKSLHKKATWVAERERVSLNQFIVSSLAETVGERRSAVNVTISVHQPQYFQSTGQPTMPVIGFSGSFHPSRFTYLASNLPAVMPAVWG
jgi:antitoxin HicB